MSGLVDADVRTALRAAATAELAWAGPSSDGDLRGEAVTPLLLDDVPVVAVPYAFVDWARVVASAPEVTLTVSDPRLSGSRWRALRLRARPRLVEDREGELFGDRLLDEELRKHPPSRALVDSMLLRRENWWYLPRLLVHLDVLEVESFVERFGGDDALLVAGDRTGGQARVTAVTVSGWGTTRLGVEPLAADRALPPDGSPVLLLGHDFTEPDMERWDVTRGAGTFTGGAVVTSEPVPRPGAGRMPGLVERLRRHRDLRRGCLRALQG